MRVSLFILVLIFKTALSFTLQGKWRTVTTVDRNFSVPVEIKEIIYGQTQIIRELKVFVCNTLTYKFNIDESNIWIQSSQDSSLNCSDSDGIIILDIQKAIQSAFTFQIVAQKLIFYDVKSNPVLVLTKEVKNSKSEITGSWITNVKVDEQSTYLIIADNTIINICNTVFNYVIQSPYSISLEMKAQSACQNPTVISSLAKTSFFRKHNGKLRLYDSRLSLLAQARYKSNQTQIPQLTPAIRTSFGAGNYILLLLFRRDLGRVKIQITGQSIKFNICTQLQFTYALSSQNKISIKGVSTPNPKCKKADQTIYFNYLTSATSYTIDSDGVITLNDSANKDIISLAP